MATTLFNGVPRRAMDWFGPNIPSLEGQEGCHLNTEATVAPYLPLQHFSTFQNDWLVMMPGTMVAADSNGYLVPAGYALDRVAEVAAPGSAEILYTADDVANNVVGPDGVVVTAGVSVASLLVSEGITIGNPFALALGAVWRAGSDTMVGHSAKSVGGGGLVPTEWRNLNYVAGQVKVDLVTQYSFWFPLVTAYDPVLPGIKVYNTLGGSAPEIGGYVKVDALSNFVSSVKADAYGQVKAVDKVFPKAYLQYVLTAYGEGTGGGAGTEFEGDILNQLPGSASAGLPDQITFAGGTAALGRVLIGFKL